MGPPEGMSLPLAWVGLEELPIAYANQFVIQFEADASFVLSIGQVTGPALLGESPEEIQRQAEQIEFVPVRPIARIAMTQKKVQELIGVLEANLKNFETMQAQIDPRGLQ